MKHGISIIEQTGREKKQKQKKEGNFHTYMEYCAR